MSIYVMSDIHGEYDKYRQMLEKIGFSEEDELYILGDVIDRGEEPIKVLLDMASRPNVYPIVGNHEIMAIAVLEKILKEVTESNAQELDSETMLGLMEWMENGGETTLKGLRKLPNSKRLDILDYMSEFNTCEALDVGDRTFILVHSTLGNFSKDKKLREYQLHELAEMRADYDRQLFDDKSIFIVSGHTPTQLINGKAEIYHNCNNIDIDCGATFGGKLACLRLDDMQEFYV